MTIWGVGDGWVRFTDAPSAGRDDDVNARNRRRERVYDCICKVLDKWFFSSSFCVCVSIDFRFVTFEVCLTLTDKIIGYKCREKNKKKRVCQ